METNQLLTPSDKMLDQPQIACFDRLYHCRGPNFPSVRQRMRRCPDGIDPVTRRVLLS